jgi:hypothetical protein
MRDTELGTERETGPLFRERDAIVVDLLPVLLPLPDANRTRHMKFGHFVTGVVPGSPAIIAERHRQRKVHQQESAAWWTRRGAKSDTLLKGTPHEQKRTWEC